MRLKVLLITIVGLTILLVSAPPPRVWSQTPQGQQVVAVRAGRMFDPKTGTNVPDQVVLIRGDRITDVGPAARVQIPAGARVIDLSKATVLPGLIDGHVHLTDGKGDQRQEAIHHFLLDLLREVLAHDAGGDLAGTEAGDLGLTAELVRDALRFGVDQVRGDLHFDGFADRGEIGVVQEHRGLQSQKADSEAEKRR